MKVILLKDVIRLGKRGDVKDVADVYGTNVLIKNAQAIVATTGELAKWKQKAEAQKFKKEMEINLFTQLVHTLRNKDIVIAGKKSDAKKQLFAQIKETDIVDAIFKIAQISIDPKQIRIPNPIKSLGFHFVEVKQGLQKEMIKVEVK